MNDHRYEGRWATDDRKLSGSSDTSPFSVLVIDDHAMVREMIGLMLAGESDMQVVGMASNAEEGVHEALQCRPNVVILDIDMPGLSCFDAARQLGSRLPNTRIVFLSAFFNDRYIEQALEVEAAAYVTKSEPLTSVVRAVRAVAAGAVYFSPEVQSRIVIDSKGARLADKGRTRSQTLTNREVEVLRYLARGMSTKEIAATLHISVKTVDRHRANLMSKLDIHDRVELARFAIREGISEA